MRDSSGLVLGVFPSCDRPATGDPHPHPHLPQERIGEQDFH
jgi:hypothetical protein